MTEQRKDVDHYLYRLMPFSPAPIYFQDTYNTCHHPSARHGACQHNKTKVTLNHHCGQRRLTVSQSDAWSCQHQPIRGNGKYWPWKALDREEYSTGTMASSEHLRGQFGAKCDDPWSCCVTVLRWKIIDIWRKVFSISGNCVVLIFYDLFSVSGMPGMGPRSCQRPTGI